MNLKYQSILFALALAVGVAPAQLASAQAGDTLWVEWQDGNGDIIINALQQAIANDADRPANRVYGLHRSGLYYNSEIVAANNGYHLQIVGSTVPQEGEQDFGPPVIQMVAREDGSEPGRLLTVQDDLTLKNLWITGQTDAGTRTAYLPIFVEASDRRIVVDNVIFERTNFSMIGLGGAGNSVYITDSVFRNHDNSSQQWEGRGIRFEAGGDTLVMENNTFLNFGHTIVQSEAQPVDYVRFNHNTMVNVGRTVNSGSIWKTALFTNNVAVNPFWHGEGAADYNAPGREAETSGWFGIGDLPPAFGTNLERRIVYANNVHWRDPQFAAYYADTIRAQPLFNEITQEFFDTYEAMVEAGNLWDVNPELPSYTTAPTVAQFPETSIPLADLVPNMIRNMRDLREGLPTPFTSWLWDPGREPTFYEGAGFVYPLPEDFMYSNASLTTAGTDGLPLGDLNWFPDAKETFEANKDQYVAAIENMAAAPDISVVSTLEAEDAALSGAAEVAPVEGFTYFRFESGGYVEWTFEMPAAGTVDLHLHTNMGTETRRGQRVIVNGTNLRNHSGYGEYYFCAVATEPDCADQPILPPSTWATVEITPDVLVEGVEGLNLVEGTNTIRLEPSWGYQNFSGIDVVDPVTGEVVIELTATTASSEIAIPFCEEAEFCPQGFHSVMLSGAGTVEWNATASAAGEYFLRIFYNADSDVPASLLVDGAEVLSLVFAATEPTGGSIVTDRFSMSPGAHNIEISTASGDLNLDYAQLLGYNLIVGTERYELPEGYALDQNYPNPFNPVTTIRYEMAAPGEVRLTVYDLLGRRVRTLVQGQQTAGAHQIVFDGAGLSSGVYFYRIEMPVGSQVRKMTLVK